MADSSLSLEQAALNEAITGLYTTFARYPLRHIIKGCPHCVTRANSDASHVRALNALTPDDLYYYAFKAMTTFGDADDFKHFLPRLLELLARELEGGEQLGINEEILESKLARAEYAGWPEAERAAVNDFFDAMWRTLLARYPTQPEAKTFLCILALYLEDWDHYLAVWRNTLTRTALAHVAVAAFEPPLSGFWPKHAKAQFEAWLAEDETIAMVRLAADEWRAGAYRDQLPYYAEAALQALAAN